MDISLEQELGRLVSYLDSISQLDESSQPEDVIELKSNLIELIELKKEQLFEYKKSSLLQKCDNRILEVDSTLDPVGTICSIEFRFKNGSVGRRNVVIFEREYFPSEEDDATEAGVHFRCFFAHPVYRSELPCERFLENEECLEQNRCGRSHGVVIEAQRLQEPVDTTATNDDCQWREGDRCLAQVRAGDIWRRCRLLFVDETSASCVVELVQMVASAARAVLDNTFDVPLSRVIRCDDDCYTDNDSSHDDGRDEVPDIEGQGTSAPVIEAPPAVGAIGAWEQHTRGIGMKLLLQMGYRSDRGLGKTLQGRLEPVAAAQTTSLGTDRKPGRRRNRHGDKSMVNVSSGAWSVEAVKRAMATNEAKTRLAKETIARLEQTRSRHGHPHGHPLLGQLEARLSQTRQKLEQLARTDARLAKQLEQQRRSSQHASREKGTDKTRKKLDIF